MSSSKDENHDLRKKIGCMNGIFQIFDGHHFLMSRRVNSYTSKRLLQGGQHHMDQQYAKDSALEKGLEMQKEKPRISTESSRPSFSSSSCSSTFSSLDFSRTIHPETLSLSPFQTTAASKESQRSSTKGIRSHDLRDVVKDSMHRELSSLSIKPQNSDGKRGTVMKHIDSPRPSQQSKTEKPKIFKDEKLTLPRFSYDERESREVYKSSMKHKELPRLSLDSKTSSRLSSVQSNQESGSHARTSSIVARLMGLEAPPSMKSCRKEASLEEHKQNQVNMASKSRKAAETSALHQTSSVYGLIEKRITDLEFEKSRKDLRALKQILEAMQKTRARLEAESSELTSQRRCSLEERCHHQNPNLSVPTVVVVKPEKVMEKVRLSEASHLQNLQTRTPRYYRESSAHIQKANILTTQNRSVKNHGRHLVTADRKTSWIELESVKNNGITKLTDKGYQSRKNKVKAKDQQLSDDKVSKLSRGIISLDHSINTNSRLDKTLVPRTRENMPAVESAVNILEQPSPISVLDSSFYCEDLPSPIKKISTVFQEDEGSSPTKEEWCPQNHNNLMGHSFKHNQKLENMRKSVQELTQLNKVPNGTAANHDDGLNPSHRQINKILFKSELLKESSFVVLEQGIREAVNRAVVGKSDKLKLDKRIQRKMIFDLVDEILLSKISSSILLTKEKKKMSPQRLLEEVSSEMERLSTITDCNVEIMAADMKHRSEDWVDCSGEIPDVVLDIERMVYKDLINEVITCEIMDGCDWPKRHCRKLFVK